MVELLVEQRIFVDGGATSFQQKLTVFNLTADAGQLVDSYISGKIVQLKEQIATLEKREERSGHSRYAELCYHQIATY